MFQRKQTLFLSISVVLNLVFILFPFAQFTTPDGLISYTALGLEMAPDTFSDFPNDRGVLYLSLFGVIFGLIAILLYKKHSFQMRLCMYALTSNLLLIGFAGYFIYMLNGVEDIQWIPMKSFPFIFPFLNLFLLVAAFNGVRKDKALLDSYNRVR